MSVNVTFIDDPFDHSNWKIVENTEDLLDCIIAEYPDGWPKHARIYKGAVSEQTDCTPQDDKDIQTLKEAEGNYYVVNIPGFGIDTLLYVALAASVVAAVAFKPKIPNNTQRSQTSKSPNNSLTERTNTARPNGRIPDIFGTVRSTPDLITLPYTTYNPLGKEIENSLLCIGRGQHEIHDCKDGTTSIFEIDGATVNVWKPNQNIRTVAPYFQKGAWLNGPVLQLQRNDAVNGQTLKPGSQAMVQGNNDIQFLSPNIVQIAPSSFKTFNGVFNIGQSVDIANANAVDPLLYRSAQARVSAAYPNAVILDNPDNNYPTWLHVGDAFTIVSPDFPVTLFSGGVVYETTLNLKGRYIVSNLLLYEDTNAGSVWRLVVTFTDPQSVASDWQKTQFAIAASDVSLTFDVNDAANLYNLDGRYVVESINGQTMTLVNPVAVNPDWADVGPVSEPYLSPTIGNLDSFSWIGEFTADNPNTTEIIANIVATNGLYGDNGQLIYPLFLVVYLEYKPVDASGTATGPTVRGQYTLTTGQFEYTDAYGYSIRLSGLAPSRYKVRVARQTPKLDFIPDNNFVDEIKWKDFYYGVAASITDYGNVTIVRSETVGTEGALSLKERRLNLLVTRQINLRVSGTTFTPDLYSTNRSDEILAFVALDPKLGARDISELDVDNVYDTIMEANDYFGFQAPIEFCYTFDSQMTFEDTWQTAANAVFCQAYRRGSTLRLTFEGRTNDSTILFNHRNKIPGSETRTERFGPAQDFDGVALTWVSPEDDAIVTKYIPADRSAKKEKKVETIGVRNEYQAYIHAWRYYQKQIYQNSTVSFTATEESELTVISDRILVADNTRPDTQDGEIVNALGLILIGSQEVSFDPAKNYTIFLQMYDGTVQALDCFGVSGNPNGIAISQPPRFPLVFGDDRYAKTTYVIIENNDPRQSAYLLTDRNSNDNNTSEVTAINYDARYYEHDNDLFPPIERGIYLSSRPYVSELSDAMAPTVTIGIHASPTVEVSDKWDQELTIGVQIISVGPRTIESSDKWDQEVGISALTLKNDPATSAKDAMGPTVNIGLHLVPVIYYTNGKDAMAPTINIGIALT